MGSEGEGMEYTSVTHNSLQATHLNVRGHKF